MDWNLLARGVFGYALVGGGGSVAAVTVLTEGIMPLFVTGLVGMALLLFVGGGSTNVRMGTVGANAEAGGLRSGIVDPADNQRTSIGSDLKLFFVGGGLVAVSIAFLASGLYRLV